MKTRDPIRSLFCIALRMQFWRTTTAHRYAGSFHHLQTRASGIDRASNKIYERQLHAEPRSALYDPFDIDTGSAGGYDSANRLRQYQRGTLAATNGYLNQGGGKITSAITLSNTDTQRTYDLDGLGNWKHSNYTPVGGSATEDLRQHNKLNEITRRSIGGTGYGGAGVSPAIPFTYDKNGNLQDDGTLLYSYNALNRLIEVKRKSDNAIIGQYVYDAQNRRISKTVSNGGWSGDLPNGTTAYLYQDWQVIEERDSDDTTTKQYIWGDYIDELIQMKTAVTSGGGNLPAGDYYPLQDLLYRTTTLTDDSGNIVETYDTDAYGNTLVFKSAGTNDNWWADDVVQTDTPACEIIYAGYRYDPETELYYVRNRTYNPALGRWLQRDRLMYQDGLNLYEYVESEPTTKLDAYGMAGYTYISNTHVACCGGGLFGLIPKKNQWSITWKKFSCGKWKPGGTVVGGCGESLTSVRSEAFAQMSAYTPPSPYCCVYAAHPSFQNCMACCTHGGFSGMLVNIFPGSPGGTEQACISYCFDKFKHS